MIGREREDPPAAYARHGKTVPGWVWWELPLARGADWDPGPGHAVVAHIVDSDVADIRGLVAGERAWRWVYGEAALAAFEERPVDDLELEDSLPGRAEDASHLIQAWAAEAGLPEVNAPALAAILQRGYTFAEEGVSDVLEALGIVADDSAVEHQDLDPAVDADGRPFGEEAKEPAGSTSGGPTMAGVLAAPIDHRSAAWRALVADHSLHTFGEPPSLVALDGTLYVAFDPPILLVSFGPDADRGWVSAHLDVEWQEVPPGHTDSLLAAATWARENVGVQGRPAETHRLPLNLEVPPDYPDGGEEVTWYHDLSRQEGWRHSIARPRHAAIELAMGTDLLERADEVADWLELAHGLLLTPVADGYRGMGGQIRFGNQDVPLYALALKLVYKSARGRYAISGADDKAWRRVQKRLRAGELTSVRFEGTAAGDSLSWGKLLIGAQLAADQRLYSLPAHLTVEISDPLRSFLPGPFVHDLITRAVETLPVVGGWVDAARLFHLGDGRSRYEEFAGVSSGVRRDPRTSVRGPAWRILLGPEHLRLLGGRAALEESGVFTGFQEIGTLLQVECGAQPADCTWERRAAMVDVLAPVLPPAARGSAPPTSSPV
jgi:hypothetical protein